MKAAQVLRQLFCFFVFLLFLVRGIEAASVAAQSDMVTWFTPINLSNTPPNSEYPAMVADSFGYIHVFWSEDVGGEPFQYGAQSVPPGNSIMYTRWDGVSWTSPLDILIVPDEKITDFIAVDVDAHNRLHVIWTGQSNIYYSNAPAWQAESAHAWSKPLIVATNSARSRWGSDVTADVSGVLHLVYATRGEEAGVYYLRSQDEGETWGSPTKLSLSLDRLELGFSNVQIVSDRAGRLHAVWQTFQKEGFGQAIYYARSIDQGQSWSQPIQLGHRDPGDYEASYPYLVSRSESELHLIYLDGPHQGRSHRISNDGGETWSEPYHIIPEMEGVNGYVFPLIDGSGQMHLIINMRTIKQVHGLYYARWLGSGWSPVVPVDLADESQGGSHYAAGTVRLGNELHVVWYQLSKGEIGYIRGVIPGIVQTAPLAIPIAQPLTLLPSPTPALAVNLPTVTSMPKPVPLATVKNAPAQEFPFPVDPLITSLGASLLLVGSVILWIRLHSH